MRHIRQVIILTGAVVLFCLSPLLMSIAQAAGSPIVFPYQQVVGLGSSKCIDVHDGNPSDGTKIDIYMCNGTVAQQWTAPGNGTIQALGKCMDVHDASTDEGTSVDLYTCNGTVAQQWVRATSGALLNPNSGQCLDVPANTSANGAQLRIWACNGGVAQNWNFSADISGQITPVGEIVGATGFCIDVRDGSRDDGTPVQGFDCNGGLNQIWAIPGDTTIRSMGKCLDTNGLPQQFTPLVLVTCDGSGTQQWVPFGPNMMRTASATLCISGDPSFGIQNGEQLFLEPCAGLPVAEWTFPS